MDMPQGWVRDQNLSTCNENALLLLINERNKSYDETKEAQQNIEAKLIPKIEEFSAAAANKAT